MQMKKWFVMTLVGSVVFVSGLTMSLWAAEKESVKKFDSQFFVGNGTKPIPEQVVIFTEYKLLPSSVFEFKEDLKIGDVILSKNAITFNNTVEGIGLNTRYIETQQGIIIDEDIMIMGHQSVLYKWLSGSDLTESNFVLHYYTIHDQVIIMFEFCDNAYKDVITILNDNIQNRYERSFNATMVETIYNGKHFSTVTKLLAFLVYKQLIPDYKKVDSYMNTDIFNFGILQIKAGGKMGWDMKSLK